MLSRIFYSVQLYLRMNHLLFLITSPLIEEIISFLQSSCCTLHPQYFFLFYFIFKLYNIVLVLPNIKMNPPQVYMCSPSWTFLPPPSPYHSSGSSQCTSPKHPVSCIKPGLATRFISPVFIYLLTGNLYLVKPLFLKDNCEKCCTFCLAIWLSSSLIFWTLCYSLLQNFCYKISHKWWKNKTGIL